MDKETKIQVGIIVVLLIVLIIMCVIYFSDNDNKGLSKDEIGSFDMETTTVTSDEDSTLVTSSSEIKSALTENVELHATYYLEECYVQENEVVEAGANILKYTNGTYLTAPYKCVISALNIPESSGQCTNEHYVEISSVNILSVSLNVDESIVDQVSIGDEATITVSAFEDKTLTGNVTKISSIGSNGKFEVTVEFENDGDIMLGMSSKVSI